MTDSVERTRWFRQAGWGVFTHYLAAPASGGPADLTPDEWNRQVDSFDVPRLAAQLRAVGAPYYFITIGQNTGFYCSPNDTYDGLVGRRPSRLSRRDLVAEIADALEPLGVRTMVYLPSHAPARDRPAVERLVCTPDWDASKWQLRPGTYLRTKETDARLSEFQRNWEAIIREWSLRWGRKVHGWWIDGCYHADRMYRHPDPPNFRSFAEALRAGNPESIVAFNPGVKVPVITLTEYEDYTAGEIAGALPATPAPWEEPSAATGRVGQARYHILTYLGRYWGRGEPRFSQELAAAYTRHIIDQGGVISWDVPITTDGRIPDAFLRILEAIGKAV